MRDVDVTHLEAGTLAVQAPRSQRAQPPLVRQLRQRVGLVDDLTQLAAAEEVLDRRGNTLGIDQRARCHILLITDAHAFLDRAPQFEETLAQLVGCQLVDGAQTAVAQVVDVVQLALAGAQPQNVTNGVEIIERLQRHLQFRDPQLEKAKELFRPTFPSRYRLGSWNFSRNSSLAFSSCGGLPGRKRW